MLSQTLIQDIHRWGGDRPAAPGALLSAQVPSSTDLLKPTVLLHQRRKHTGAAGWRGLHIIITEAAEEGAEDATVPLFLQADVALGCWKEKSTLRPTAARTRGRNATRKLERAVAPQSPHTRRPTQHKKMRGPRKSRSRIVIQHANPRGPAGRWESKPAGRQNSSDLSLVGVACSLTDPASGSGPICIPEPSRQAPDPGLSTTPKQRSFQAQVRLDTLRAALLCAGCQERVTLKLGPWTLLTPTLTS